MDTTSVLSVGIVVPFIDVAVATPIFGVVKIGESTKDIVSVPFSIATPISLAVPSASTTPRFSKLRDGTSEEYVAKIPKLVPLDIRSAIVCSTEASV